MVGAVHSATLIMRIIGITPIIVQPPLPMIGVISAKPPIPFLTDIITIMVLPSHHCGETESNTA